MAAGGVAVGVVELRQPAQGVLDLHRLDGRVLAGAPEVERPGRLAELRLLRPAILIIWPRRSKRPVTGPVVEVSQSRRPDVGDVEAVLAAVLVEQVAVLGLDAGQQRRQFAAGRVRAAGPLEEAERQEGVVPGVDGVQVALVLGHRDHHVDLGLGDAQGAQLGAVRLDERRGASGRPW